MPPFFKTAGDWLRGDRKTLAAGKGQPEPTKRFLSYKDKAVSRTRKDIADWNKAYGLALSGTPKNWQLQQLYDEIMLDALLTSQMENRRQQVLSRSFVLKNEKGETDEEQTAILRQRCGYQKLSKIMMDVPFRGYALVELSQQPATDGKGSMLVVDGKPATNVVPKEGKFYPDYAEDKAVLYREMNEFGTYILEFDGGTLGLLNKAVPHVLFKKFAQSCWSELCEIYGIPPRVMKTNTQDANMLNRAEQMMRDMSAAAWFIIDETEKMEWATGTSTNGEVYQKLIALCNSEISLLIAGAVMGQDTQNGNRSKDEAAQEMLWELSQGDLVQMAEWWNTIVLPALVKLGMIKKGLRFEFETAEDMDQLWSRTKDSLPYFVVDPAWVKTKFGIEVTGERTSPTPAGTGKDGKENLSLDGFFS